MSINSLSSISNKINEEDGNEELRRGPWTLEEDNLLIRHISFHGEGRWNSLAKHSGLMRTGKSCRLRWLNYLKPDVKRGNLTPQEQLLILQLHSKWGNRWSKIALHLPGRTDNEIKNYWRTRVQKQARHLKIDSSSAAFQEVIRCIWMPRLLQKINGSSPPEQHHNSSFNPDHQLPNSSSDNSIDCWSSDQPANINKSSALEKTDQAMLCDHLFDELESMNHVLPAAPPSPDFHVADSNWIIDDDVAYGSWNMDELWAFQDGGGTLKN